MSNAVHISEEKLTEYALATLPPSEQNSMHAHFLLCATCREELRQKSLALAAYGAAVPQVFVPIGARDRFFDSLTSTGQSAQASPPKRFNLLFLQRLAPYFAWLGKGRWALVLSGLLAIALFILSINYLRLATQFHTINGQAHEGEIDSARMNELLDLLTSAKAMRADLRQTPTLIPPPEGHVMYSSEHGTLYFSGSSLQALPVGKSYELWILQRNNQPPIAAGAFTPDNYGFATLIPPPLPEHLSIQGYVVTIEDAVGSTTPTLPYVVSSLQ
jgi:hypothetical protein